MNETQFAEFWERQGYRVIHSQSCYWYKPASTVLTNLPFHRLVRPTISELYLAMTKTGVLAVRCLAPMDYQIGHRLPGGLIVCRNKAYQLASLHKKARNQTLRGLENCHVEQVDFTYLKVHGQALNRDTFERQNRDVNILTESAWNRQCEVASSTSGLEAWAAFSDRQLDAFLILAEIEGCAYILHQSSRSEALGHYANNALAFTVTQRKISQPDIDFVCYGRQSLEATTGLDHFKMRMGFQIDHCNDLIWLNPALEIFVRLGGRRFINYVANRYPKNDFWRKSSSVLAGLSISEQILK